jgi:antitoxin (DNA-binding transcriptional repressor) of toxin-antitoxin stability system
MAVHRDLYQDGLLRRIFGGPEPLPGLPIEEALAHLPEILGLVTDGERIVLRREGQPPVALVPIGDLEWIQELEDRRDAAAAEAAMEEGGDPIPSEEIKRQFGL